jgi:maleate isomerase
VTPRLALLVPPANPTAEPELNELLLPGIAVCTARLPLLAGAGLRERLEGYNGAILPTVRQFGDLTPGAILVACTGSSYLLGPEGDNRLCEDLSARLGSPLRTATAAIRQVLNGLGAGELRLVTGYEPWLTELSLQFWTQSGFEVTETIEVRPAAGTSHFSSPYDVATADILRALERSPLSGEGALLFTGTGMPTLEVIGDLVAAGAGDDAVIVSSNSCGALWARRSLAGDVRERTTDPGGTGSVVMPEGTAAFMPEGTAARRLLGRLEARLGSGAGEPRRR